MRENTERDIQWRTVLIILVLDLIILTFIYWNIICVQGKIIKQAEASFVREQIHVLEASLLELGEGSQTLNQAIASYPEVKQSIINPKRQPIKALSLPDYSGLQDKYSLTNIRTISSKGLALATVNKSMAEEEDVSYRRLIAEPLRAKESLVAFESAGTGINLVSITPIFMADKFIGLSEIDMSLEQALARKLAKKDRGQYAIFQLDGIHSSLIGEEKTKRMVLNTSDIKKIHQGEAFYRSTPNKKIMLLVVPLKDIDDIPIGYIQGEISRQAFLEARTNNLLFLIIITLLIIIVSSIMVGRPGAGYAHSQHEAVNLVDSGKISRVSINVKPVKLDNFDD